jgi:membrane-associated phospholipid phosphatase
MNIKQVLLDADIAVFRFINTAMHNDIAAAVMKFTANDIFLSAVVFAGLFFLVKKYDIKAKNNIAYSLWALITVNFTSTCLLKPFFKRLRPMDALPDVNFLLEVRKYGWAFPSTHTAMAAALVTVLWDDYKNPRWVMALFVFFVGFFCIYTGGHYPADVLAGLFLGVIVGTIFNKIKVLSQNSKVKS